jgi:hypothetical protein
MAEKHKSKYKKPENTKYKTRKDLKDYTTDDKKGGLNPKSAGEKQTNVLRKTDKEVVDNGNYVEKYNADDRLYKDIESGEYDTKHAAKVLKKRQDKDEKDNEKNIQDKIENLTREQKERLVREYVRRKISKLINEAEEPELPTEEIPSPQPTAPEAPEAPETTPAPEPTTEPTAPTAAPAPETAPVSNPLDTFIIDLQSKNNRKKIETLANALNKLFPADSDQRVRNNFYLLLRQLANRKIIAEPQSTPEQ